MNIIRKRNIMKMHSGYKNIKKLILVVSYFTLSLGFLTLGLDVDYLTEYYFVYFGFIFVSGIYVLLSLSTNIKIIDPITLVTFLYIMFFSIAPMIDIITNNTLFFGHFIIGGTFKATFLYIVGYLFFVFGYSQRNYGSLFRYSHLKLENKNTIINVSLFLWFIGLVSSFIFLATMGHSVIYMLTFGQLGSVTNNNQLFGTQLGFLSMLTYAMVVPWLYLFLTLKNKLWIIILTTTTLSIYFVLGFRFIIIIMVMAPIIFKYLHKKKDVSIRKILLLAPILLVVFGIIGFVRGDLRRGNQVDLDGFSITDVWYTIESNFEIYKAFYRLTEMVPDQFDYTYGSQSLYTAIILVPRVLWESKPDTPLRDLMENVLGENAVVSGTAWPNIGEYYSEFGVIGVIMLSYFLGILMKKSTELIYGDRPSFHSVLAYSVIYPTYIQVVIRGYTPTNFWLLFMLLGPIVLLSKLKRKNSY